MKKICDYCHNEYETDIKKQRFCSDLCRVRAYRERQRTERKKAVKAYKDRQPQPRRKYDNVISETDPRRRLVTMRPRGLFALEYWKLYAEVDKTYYGGRGVVNGINTDDPNFAELVLITLEVDRRLVCTTQGMSKK